MIAGGQLLVELRAGLKNGLVSLEAQAVAIGWALSGRLPTATRPRLRRAADQIGRRVVTWEAGLGDDEAELRVGLEGLAHQVRVRERGSRAAQHMVPPLRRRDETARRT